jgi:hypothetical protein
MADSDNPKNKFSSTGFKLILFFLCAITLMSGIGLLLLVTTELRQFPLKMILLGFWGQIFVGAGYLYALAEGHLRHLSKLLRFGTGGLIAALIVAGWLNWDYASSHEGKGVVVHDGGPLPQSYVNQQILEAQQKELEEAFRRNEEINQRLERLRTSHFDDSTIIGNPNDTLFGVTGGWKKAY